MNCFIDLLDIRTFATYHHIPYPSEYHGSPVLASDFIILHNTIAITYALSSTNCWLIDISTIHSWFALCQMHGTALLVEIGRNMHSGDQECIVWLRMPRWSLENLLLFFTNNICIWSYNCHSIGADHIHSIHQEQKCLLLWAAMWNCAHMITFTMIHLDSTDS